MNVILHLDFNQSLFVSNTFYPHMQRAIKKAFGI